MIHISEATLQALTVHKVGNHVTGGECVLSDKVFTQLKGEVVSPLMHYFFTPFKGDSFFHFEHAVDLNLNNVFLQCSKVFDDDRYFGEASREIAKTLFHSQEHPNIKDGELYVALFRDVIVETEVCDAIGIFKAEQRETYLDMLNINRGVNIDKLDKGCLIFHTERENGYKVCVVDKSKIAGYWMDGFLGVKPLDDNYYQTRNYLSVCKEFVKDVFNSENNVDRVDQAVMLNKVGDYFKDNEVFNAEEFEATVMQDAEIIEAFRDHKEHFESYNQVVIKDEFCIATPVVKSVAKTFKSVIKLDKNFHLYVHGNQDHLEKGFDEEKGMKFYKMYFNEEA